MKKLITEETIEVIVEVMVKYADKHILEDGDHVDYVETGYYCLFSHYFNEFLKWAEEDKIITSDQKSYFLSEDEDCIREQIIESADDEYQMIIQDRGLVVFD